MPSKEMQSGREVRADILTCMQECVAEQRKALRVKEIAARVHKGTNGVLYHLKLLRKQGMVWARKRGRWYEWRLTRRARRAETPAVATSQAAPTQPQGGPGHAVAGQGAGLAL